MPPAWPASRSKLAMRSFSKARRRWRAPMRLACSLSVCPQWSRPMASDKPLKIAIVAGEESGDLLGADIVRALQRTTGRRVQLVGIGGRHLQELGLTPLFDGAEIALMGFSAVLRDLPRLMR